MTALIFFHVSKCSLILNLNAYWVGVACLSKCRWQESFCYNNLDKYTKIITMPMNFCAYSSLWLPCLHSELVPEGWWLVYLFCSLPSWALAVASEQLLCPERFHWHHVKVEMECEEPPHGILNKGKCKQQPHTKTKVHNTRPLATTTTIKPIVAFKSLAEMYESAGYFRVKFVTPVIVIKHNFVHDKYHLLTNMFRTNISKEKGWNMESEELPLTLSAMSINQTSFEGQKLQQWMTWHIIKPLS